MWVGAGAAGSKRGGWAGRSCRRPRGRVEAGSDRAGRGRAREEGRMAWGQKCHWEEKAGGRGTGPGGGSGEGSAGHCVASGGTWAARSGIPGREQSTQKVVFVPMAEHSGADSSSTGQGQSPGGSPPCCPAEATGGAGSTAPLLSWGRSVEQLPSQLPLRRQNWLCPWPHPPASVKEEKGPFARGQGHLLPRGLALPHEELQCVSRGAG